VMTIREGSPTLTSHTDFHSAIAVMCSNAKDGRLQ